MTQTKKLDRRIARTRRALSKALMELILEGGYDQITIRDLTERADIGYATFFRHYKNKDDLLTQYLGSVLQEVNDEMNPETSHYEQSLAAYSVLNRNRDALMVGLSLPRDHPAMKPLWDKVFGMVTDLYLPRDESVIPLQVSVNHIIRSVSELVRWWITEGQAYSPEQMARMQSELIITVTELVAVVPRDAEHKENPGDQRDREINSIDAPPNIPS